MYSNGQLILYINTIVLLIKSLGRNSYISLILKKGSWGVSEGKVYEGFYFVEHNSKPLPKNKHLEAIKILIKMYKSKEIVCDPNLKCSRIFTEEKKFKEFLELVCKRYLVT